MAQMPSTSHIFSDADAMDVASGAVGSGDGCASLAAHADPPGGAMDVDPVDSGLVDAVAALCVDDMDDDPVGSKSCDKGATPEAACAPGSGHRSVGDLPSMQQRPTERWEETAEEHLERVLRTQLAEGAGRRMMERMGWVPGETLGVNGHGLQVPLRPDLSRRGERTGLGYKGIED